MKSFDIRKMFLEYFKSQGHTVVPSSPLVPRHDPSLLFVNAGMVQFKSVFLGEQKRQYTRAASCQKCMRAGGKHSDLENVGHTARHHTFFEMLGNFSFGDYFKREAMTFAWDFLTGVLKLPKERLYVSVYEEDDEAASLWSEAIGVPAGRIIRLGAKDNFWQMGDTGPCGPCSEIIFDQGEGFGCRTPDCKVGCDCDRYLELWNLVFMQFNRDESGALTPLPKPSIDTGMGLERITAVLQNKRTNFDTDIFAEIISSISSHSGTPYGSSPETDISIRVIADHIRAVVFLLADGLMPSNEGRGYVLRRIMRRAARHARLLGTGNAFLHLLVDAAANAMGSVYPELLNEKERASRIVLFEEEKFARTLEQGVKLLDGIMETVKKERSKIIPGAEIFKLYDTFGFPLDLARDMAIDNDLLIDEEGFHREMEMQRERARASWVGEEEAIASIYKELEAEVGPTVFEGYQMLEASAVVKALLQNGKVMKEAVAGDDVELILDRTPFYGESGGQTGDTGIIFGDGVEAKVLDTKKEAGLHSHLVKIVRGKITVWDNVRCIVDLEKRMATARNHTATHLLQAALRNILGEHVKQAGSFVSPERLRFDFSHFHQLERDEIEAVEDFVNARIVENIEVQTEAKDLREAIKAGVTALFGEKYGETVRVVSVPGVSSELCGGTHCSASGEIGFFVILSESSVASGIRRIEALTGKEALKYFRQRKAELEEIKALLKSDRPAERIEKLLGDLKAMEKELLKLKTGAGGDALSTALKDIVEVEGIKLVRVRQDGLNHQELRLLSDNLRDRIRSGIIVAFSVIEGNVAIICMVTNDLTGKYNAGDIMKQIAKAGGGKGGGKAELAQGGMKDVEKLDEVMQALPDMIRKP